MEFRAPIVQIAGVHDADEARLVVRGGARLIGFPLRLPVHAPDLSEDEARDVIAGLPPYVVAVAITYLGHADAVADLCASVGAGAVQLHGDIAPDELRRLRRLCPGLGVLKSLVVGARPVDTLADQARDLSPLVDAFITDTFDPATGASGATGRTHDWTVSRRLVAASSRPVILAGGLTPANVRRAILEVRPAGVDAHTGVENADGRKGEQRVRQFVDEAMAGFAAVARARV